MSFCRCLLTKIISYGDNKNIYKRIADNKA